MEKSKRIAVVPADFGWSDVGSFAALPDVKPTDRLGNVAEGDAVVVDAHNVWSSRRAGGRWRWWGSTTWWWWTPATPSSSAAATGPRTSAQAVEELARRGRDEVL